MKLCCACHGMLPEASYSKKQWQARKIRRCKECVSANRGIDASPPKSVADVVLGNDDTFEGIAPFLDCVDLARLSATSKDISRGVDRAASRLISSLDVRYGGDEGLSRLEQLWTLGSPLEFDSLLGSRIGYVDGDKACVYSSNPNSLHTPLYIEERTGEETGFQEWEGRDATAICSRHVMTSGKHYAKFTIATSDDIVIFRYVYCRIGIMRPIPGFWGGHYGIFCPLKSAWFNDFLGEKTLAWGESNKHCVLYYDFDGACEWGDWTFREFEGVHTDQPWEGQKGFELWDGELGLLLDLDEGTLTVYRNGTRLGVMMDGLTGEYCWVVNMLAQSHGHPSEQNVRVERAPIPD